MKSFCMPMTTTTGGIIARIEVAMMTGQSAVSSPDGEHLLDAHDDGVHRRVRGDQKRPEILVPAIDEEDDEERGDVRAAHRQQDIDEEAHRAGAVDMRAASINSSGMVMKNCRKRNVAVAEAISGKIRPE